MRFTKLEIANAQRMALKKLLNFAGSASHLSKMIGVSNQVIHAWSLRGRISKSGARKVAEHETLGIAFTFEELRPDTVE